MFVIVSYCASTALSSFTRAQVLRVPFEGRNEIKGEGQGFWRNAAAGAQSTYTTLATNAEVALQSGLLADYSSYIGGVTSAFDGWVTTVSNGVASQYASYYGGGSDVTAVANAWRDYDQDAATAWKNRVNGDASAFQTYGANTATAAQTAATNIAGLNVTRVSNIAGDLSTYTGTVNPAVKSFKQSVSGAMAPWMTSAAGAEKAATDNSAGAVKTYETSLFAEVRNQGGSLRRRCPIPTARAVMRSLARTYPHPSRRWPTMRMAGCGLKTNRVPTAARSARLTTAMHSVESPRWSLRSPVPTPVRPPLPAISTMPLAAPLPSPIR